MSAILESFPFLSLCSKHTEYLYVREEERRREGLPLKRLCIETSSHPERLENLFEVDQVRLNSVYIYIVMLVLVVVCTHESDKKMFEFS